MGARVVGAQQLARRVWLILGSGLLGFGICSSHAVGLLAFGPSPPTPAWYLTKLISLLAAIAASAIFLKTLCRPAIAVGAVLANSVLIGACASSMPYLAMPVMFWHVISQHAWQLPGFVFAFSILVSTFALLLAFAHRTDYGFNLRKASAALLLGFSKFHSCGMPPCGPYCFSRVPHLSSLDLRPQISPRQILAITFAAILLTLLTTVFFLFDRTRMRLCTDNGCPAQRRELSNPRRGYSPDCLDCRCRRPHHLHQQALVRDDWHPGG